MTQNRATLFFFASYKNKHCRMGCQHDCWRIKPLRQSSPVKEASFPSHLHPKRGSWQQRVPVQEALFFRDAFDRSLNKFPESRTLLLLLKTTAFSSSFIILRNFSTTTEIKIPSALKAGTISPAEMIPDSLPRIKANIQYTSTLWRSL